MSSSEQQAALAEKVRSYLEDNIKGRLTIAGVAKEFHISETQLKNVFRNVFGCPVATWIRRRKMEEAAKLLGTENLTILEVAGIYGYDNGSKFARAFKSSMKLTPSAYRRAYRAGKLDT